MNIAGAITSTGSGYRRGDRGEYLDPVRSQGWQGESTNVGTAQSRSRNNGGGGGGMGDDDESCGADKCMGAGGGGGGYGSAGIAGTNTQSGIYGGEEGTYTKILIESPLIRWRWWRRRWRSKHEIRRLWRCR